MRIAILIGAWLIANAINAHETAIWFAEGKNYLPYIIGVMIAMDILDIVSPRSR